MITIPEYWIEAGSDVIVPFMGSHFNASVLGPSREKRGVKVRENRGWLQVRITSGGYAGSVVSVRSEDCRPGN